MKTLYHLLSHNFLFKKKLRLSISVKSCGQKQLGKNNCSNKKKYSIGGGYNGKSIKTLTFFAKKNLIEYKNCFKFFCIL